MMQIAKQMERYNQREDLLRELIEKTIQDVSNADEIKYHLTKVVGWTEVGRIAKEIIWPKEEDLKKMDPEQVAKLRLSKIKWYRGGSILSAKFELNDGQESPIAGSHCNTDSTFTFPENRTVRKIKVLASENWINKIQFFDESGSQIGETMSTADRGEWHTFDLEEGERLIGMQAFEDNDRYMRRLGFVTLK